MAALPPGTIGNANFAGGYLGIGLIFCLFSALKARRRGPRFALTLGLATVLAALWFSGSRGGMAAAIAGLAMMGLCLRDQLPRWLTFAGWVALAVVGCLAVLAIWHPGMDAPPETLRGAQVFESKTMQDRFWYWGAAVRIFADYPVIGTGLDTYYEFYPRYRSPADGARLGLVVADKPHNIFLEYLSNAGLLGAGSFILLIAVVIFLGYRLSRQKGSEYRLFAAAFTSALTAYCVQGFFSIDVPPLVSIGWITIAGVLVLADPGVVKARGLTHSASDPASASEALIEFRITPTEPARRLAQGAVAVCLISLVAVGIRPLRADVKARQNKLGAAEKIFPWEAEYVGRAAALRQSLAENAVSKQRTASLLGQSKAGYNKALGLQPGTLEWLIQLAQVEMAWTSKVDVSNLSRARAAWARALRADPTDKALVQLYIEDEEAAKKTVLARLTGIAPAMPKRRPTWPERASFSTSRLPSRH